MTLQEALTWIAELFEESVEDITPETLKEDIPAWDSLGILALMASLDEEFNILLTDDEMQNLKKVDDVFELLRQNGHID